MLRSGVVIYSTFYMDDNDDSRCILTLPGDSMQTLHQRLHLVKTVS